MIRRKDEIKERRVKHAQGGDNEVVFYDWLLPQEAKGHGRVFSKLVIPPGASIGYHEHIGEFGVLYILSGEATVNDNGTEVILKAGDMNLCRDGCAHGTRNDGTEDLVMMVMSLYTLDDEG